MAIETKHYSDGTSATGRGSLPDLSPEQQREFLTAEEEAYVDKLAVICGRLAAVVEWCVTNNGETLFDNPHQLGYARAALAEARAFRNQT